jgi:hypothetical protein
MEAEAVLKMLEIDSILTWLITQEDFIALGSVTTETSWTLNTYQLLKEDKYHVVSFNQRDYMQPQTRWEGGVNDELGGNDCTLFWGFVLKFTWKDWGI